MDQPQEMESISIIEQMNDSLEAGIQNLLGFHVPKYLIIMTIGAVLSEQFNNPLCIPASVVIAFSWPYLVEIARYSRITNRINPERQEQLDRVVALYFERAMNGNDEQFQAYVRSISQDEQQYLDLMAEFQD